MMPRLESPHATGKVKAEREPYAYELFSVREAVDKAVGGTWDIPSFQRNFIWTPLYVRDLAESLWCAYPIGPLLIWEREGDKGAEGRSSSLVVDGQHRLTSLCILLGKRPRWWSGKNADRWNKMASRYEVWFDAAASRPPFFRTGDDSAFDREEPRFVQVSKLLSLNPQAQPDREELRRLSARIDTKTPTYPAGAERTYDRLLGVCAMRDKTLMVTVVRHQLNDVLEIFARLNCHGIRFRRLLLRTLLQATRGLWVPRDMSRDQVHVT